MNLMNSSTASLQQYMNALRDGDKNVIYYTLDSEFGRPVIHYSRSADTCSALVVVWITKDARIYQGSVAGKKLPDNSGKNICGIWVGNRSKNRCEIVLSIEKEPPVIFPNTEDGQLFMLYAQSQGHSQFCLYDSTISGDAFSIIVSRQCAGYYLANIASLYLKPFLGTDHQLLLAEEEDSLHGQTQEK